MRVNARHVQECTDNEVIEGLTLVGKFEFEYGKGENMWSYKTLV